jgi:2-dehydro-3-deoxygalactonokinase
VTSEDSGTIVVDWGSSSFRAYRFDEAGEIAARRQAEAGILTVADGLFEDVLEREIGDWIVPGIDVVFSGMITSRNGWVETPYAGTPARLEALPAAAVIRESRRGARLRFLPGVSTLAPRPDVMRGEEIQIFGSVGAEETATLVLPGTHSKWATVTAGAITGFRTFLTGEVFALLKAHSIVGRLMPKDAAAFDEAAFRAGVRQAFDPGSAGLLNDVFTARSGALLGAFPVGEIADRLSGMLIGHEIRSGLALPGTVDGPLRIVGEDGLVERYMMALAEIGRAAGKGPPHAAVAGFRRLALLEAGRT